MISTEVKLAAGTLPETGLEVYVRRVYTLLDSMPAGRRKVDDLAKAETRSLFIEVIKQYMRETPWYGYLSLSEDFSVIMKHEPWQGYKELFNPTEADETK
jgi:hypothetical protein